MKKNGKLPKKRFCRGQALTEYAFMLIGAIIFGLMFFVLMAAFTGHGARLIGLVSWEPTLQSRSQMEAIIGGKL
ncbi:MAG: hypothetical protein E7055_11165 [Lentisphaerae bacterium]|jgi:hypothetical protein|nr:hypothetical protein [Lentisphaerota bacterium]